MRSFAALLRRQGRNHAVTSPPRSGDRRSAARLRAQDPRVLVGLGGFAAIEQKKIIAHPWYLLKASIPASPHPTYICILWAGVMPWIPSLPGVRPTPGTDRRRRTHSSCQSSTAPPWAAAVNCRTRNSGPENSPGGLVALPDGAAALCPDLAAGSEDGAGAWAACGTSRAQECIRGLSERPFESHGRLRKTVQPHAASHFRAFQDRNSRIVYLPAGD